MQREERLCRSMKRPPSPKHSVKEKAERVKTREEVLRIAALARDGLAKLYGERLRGVYLFGSFARGAADEDSDIDIAVVLDEVPSRYAEIQRTGALGSQLSLDQGALVTFFFVPEADFGAGRYAVYRTIRREGMPL